MAACVECGGDVVPQVRRRGLPKRFCSESCQNRMYQRNRRAAGLENRVRASEQSRLNRWKRELGVSAEDYAAMLEAQNGVCALCERPESRSHGCLAVDHDHVTGRVRGLLCASCNTALGRLGDNAERIQRVLAYLSEGSDAR